MMREYWRRSHLLPLPRFLSQAHTAPYVPLVLFMVALLLRLYHLDAQSLWLDEGTTWQTIQQGWDVLLADLFSPASAYPLYHLLLKGWVVLAGDSEWALRFPSALAGAGAVVLLFFTAREVERQEGQREQEREEAGVGGQTPSLFPLAAALLLLASPFALWYAQEAKAYSLLLVVSTALLWSLLRALRRDAPRDWALYGAIALTSLFVHRLAVLLLVASCAVLLLRRSRLQFRSWPVKTVLVVRLLVLVVLSAGMVWTMTQGLGGERAATGAHSQAQGGLALWLTLVRFSVNRGPGEVPWWWLLPWAILAVWGGGRLLKRAVCRSRAARVVLAFLLIPTGLFLIQLAYTRLYEPRYLMLVYPAWVLLLASPLLKRRSPPPAQPWLATGVVGAAVVISGVVLMQPGLGLFSGAAVKEPYREAIRVLARRVHPDDVVVLHPSYLKPLYDYYMPRWTADPPPEPALFADFKQGQTEFTRRDWDTARREHFTGHLRSFLLIAPEHARTVDVPDPATGDRYGLVGLYYQYSREQKKWPCGILTLNGVHLLCQESPEAYETGAIPRPSTPMRAWFGPHLRLQGYTLKATGAGGPGVYRAGGSIPISLFWEVEQQLATDYHVFLHLCRECGLPPVASDDGPPLDGYLPTSVWLPGKPARDDRSISLPADLPPGEYTLLLGVYAPGDPSEQARLPVRGGQVLEPGRLVLGTVHIVPS
jgi:4-amino-4-deoxy-L-arabinose transferase-like glycosyltransferase